MYCTCEGGDWTDPLEGGSVHPPGRGGPPPGVCLYANYRGPESAENTHTFTYNTHTTTQHTNPQGVIHQLP